MGFGLNNKVTQSETDALKAYITSLERTIQHLTLGSQIIHVASSSLNLQESLPDLIHTLHDQFHFYQTSLFLFNEEENLLVLRYAVGPIGQTMATEGLTVKPTPHSVVGWVALNHQPRSVPKVEEDPHYLTVPELPQTKSELALPLLARDRLMGVLDLQSYEPDGFQPEEVIALQLMADQIALALENSQLFADAQVRLKELESLFALSDALSTTLDINEVYRRAARVFAERLQINRVVISQWDKERDALITKGNYFFDDGTKRVGEYEIEFQMYPLEHFPSSRRVLEKQELIQFRLEDPALEPAQKALLQEMGVIHSVEIPLFAGESVMGIIELYRMPNLGVLRPHEVQLAQAMANETAITLNNAHLASDSRARVAELSTLNRFSLAISQAKSLQQVYTSARREILSMVEATGMSVVLVDLKAQTLSWAYGFEYGTEVDLSGIGPLPIGQGFSGHVIRTGEPLLINEQLEQKQTELGSFTVGVASNAWLGVPLKVSDELIGVLAVENGDDPNAFTERDMHLLQTMAGPLAISIENELLLEQTQAALRVQSQQSLWLRTAAEVAAAASGMQNMAALIQAAVDLIPERFNLYYAGLFLIEESTGYAVLRAGTGEAGRLQREQGRKLRVGGNSLIGRATADGAPRIEQDVTLSREWLYNPSLPLTRSELALPLRTPTHIIGALTVQSILPNAFGPELVDVLQIMCDQLAVAIDNAQLLVHAEARAHQQQLLNEVSANLYRAADVEKIVTIGLKSLVEQLQLPGVSLRLGQMDSNGRKTENEPT